MKVTGRKSYDSSGCKDAQPTADMAMCPATFSMANSAQITSPFREFEGVFDDDLLEDLLDVDRFVLALMVKIGVMV